MNNNIDVLYKELIWEIQQTGKKTGNRTGINTQAIFGKMLKIDVSESFPILTTKKIYWPAVLHELLWFISGDTNIKYLRDNNIRIWNEWADENGDLGPVYGHQWRNNNGVDQLQLCIDTLKSNPLDRRLIVNSWRPELLPDNDKTFSENAANGKQALPPCHYSFQFNSDGEYLDLLWNQRSVDVFLGLPFNIASYALLLKMVAQITNLKPKWLVASLGNCHIYENHKDQIQKQLNNSVWTYEHPSLLLKPNISNINNFKAKDIILDNYQHYPTIRAPVAV